jgi:glycosyltransferase involved in cell wall biosynthesis
MDDNTYNNLHKISVVIAAYNESPRIAKVLKVVEHHPLISEVIVINDGSKDNTAEVIKQFDVQLINNEKNMGKTLSIKKGVKAAKNDIIMLIDADLVGLNKKSIEDLAKPVLSGSVDWTLSLRSNSFSFMKFLAPLMKVDWLSGERVVPRALLLDPLIWSKTHISYSLETLMNKSLLKKHATFRSIPLEGVINPEKFQKESLWKGLVSQYKMVVQISKIMWPHKAIWQLIKMSYLNHKYNNNNLLQ